jgi:hypothetical protein
LVTSGQTGEGSRHPCANKGGPGPALPAEGKRDFLKRDAKKKILADYNNGFWKYSIERRFEWSYEIFILVLNNTTIYHGTCTIIPIEGFQE